MNEIKSSKRKKLIVVADDYGYCAKRNVGIEKGIREGIISKSALMVNMPAAQSGAERMKALRLESGQSLDEIIGIHLNLTEGLPITPSHLVSSLLDPLTGEFLGKFGF